MHKGEQHDQRPVSGHGEEGDSSIFYAYDDFERAILAQIRRDTYGEDIGQFSWITADEFRGFFQRLDLNVGSHVLDVACGSGGPAIFMAQSTGCRVTGIDINEGGISTGKQMAQARGVHSRVQFEHTDAGRPLPFADASFSAIICIDAINHLYNRQEVLNEWYRVLHPGGRFLFTDAVIVTGMLLRDEIIARSGSMGQFIFTPAGVHDRLIRDAGFLDLEVEDVTDTIALVTKRWHDARVQCRDYLLKIETPAGFGSGALNRGQAAHCSISRRSAAERRPRCFGGCQRAGGTRCPSSSPTVQR